MLDRLTRPQVIRLSRLEEIEDVLRARSRPQSEEVVMRISEGSAPADRHEAWVPDLREDHGWHSFSLHQVSIPTLAHHRHRSVPSRMSGRQRSRTGQRHRMVHGGGARRPHRARRRATAQGRSRSPARPYPDHRGMDNRRRTASLGRGRPCQHNLLRPDTRPRPAEDTEPSVTAAVPADAEADTGRPAQPCTDTRTLPGRQPADNESAAR